MNAPAVVAPAAAVRPRWRLGPARPWWRVPLYPIVFPAAVVLLTWAYAELWPEALIRPLVVVVLAVLGFTLAMSALVGDRDRAGLIACAVGLMILSLDDRITAILAVVAAALLIEGVAHRGHRSIVAGLATRLMTLIGAALIVVLSVVLAWNGTWGQTLAHLTRPPLPPIGTASAGSADIWVFVLDGFPGDRAATAATSYDANTFPAALRSRGFDVVRDAHSNYLITALTLTSLLAMRHVRDIPALQPPYGSRSSDWRRIRATLDDAPAFEAFREAGYSVVTVDPGYAHVQLRDVDRFIEQRGFSEFELLLMQISRVDPIVDLVAPGARARFARDRIQATFDAAKALAEEPTAGPRLVVVHVPAPHPPWVFEADGQPRNPIDVGFDGETGLTPQQAIDAGFAQATHVAAMTVDAIDAIDRADGRPPVVVVMSDHGPAIRFSSDAPLSSDIEMRASNFMAASTPGHPGLIDDHLTPVNLFPTLIDAYLGRSLPRQTDTIWAWRDSILNVVEVPPIDGWTR